MISSSHSCDAPRQFDDNFNPQARTVVTIARIASHLALTHYELPGCYWHGCCFSSLLASRPANFAGRKITPVESGRRGVPGESQMFKRILLSLTFVAALGAATLGTSSTALAWHDCHSGYGGYGYQAAYYPTYAPYYGYGYAPRVAYYPAPIRCTTAATMADIIAAITTTTAA